MCFGVGGWGGETEDEMMAFAIRGVVWWVGIKREPQAGVGREGQGDPINFHHEYCCTPLREALLAVLVYFMRAQIRGTGNREWRKVHKTSRKRQAR